MSDFHRLTLGANIAIACGICSFSSWRNVGYGQATPNDETELEQRLSRYVSASGSQWVQLVPAERLRLIEFCQRGLERDRGTGAESQWNHYLLMLGDENTIRRLIDSEDSAREWSRDLVKSGSPVAVEVLMPHIFKEERLVNRIVTDVIERSNSHYFASTIIPQILQRNPVFPPAVAEWARKLREESSQGDTNTWLESCRLTIRKWWRDNEQLFREKKYELVRPGVLPSAVVIGEK